jgi:hypothetical protein
VIFASNSSRISFWIITCFIVRTTSGSLSRPRRYASLARISKRTSESRNSFFCSSDV